VVTLQLNGRSTELRSPPDTPLLWVLRDEAGLTGTKFGCGVGACGVCTLHLDGRAAKACQITLGEAAGKAVTTIEGLAAAGHPAIDAWIAEQVPQCGYCQPAMVMAAAAATSQPGASPAALARAMSEVLCRCGSYARARKALARLGGSGSRTIANAPRPPAAMPGHAFNPWVAIGDDGIVTVRIDRAEMGQGAVTGLSMLVAEELEVELEHVRFEFAPVDRAYANPMFGEQSTGGSTSIRSSFEPLRRAGAAAREMLVAEAAAKWNVAAADCRAESGAVRHLGSNKVATYGQLAARAAKRAPPAKPPLKDASTFRLIGKATPRLDIPAHVRGETTYGIDVRLPELVYAVLQRPAFAGAALARADTSRAEATPGVLAVIEVDAGLAVVAETPCAALAGRAALDVQWKGRPGLDSAAIARALDGGLAKAGRAARPTTGDAEGVLKRAGRVVEATYATPFQAHAPMEPMNCTVRLAERDAEVWVGTQSPADVRAIAAEISGLPASSIAVHTTFLGGSFGRRMESDFVQEAVDLATRVDHPVQLLWSRDDDMRHGSFRPANKALARGTVGDDGRIAALSLRYAGPGMSLDGVRMLYDVPHYREEHVVVDLPIPVSAWRAVGASQNAFAVEGFVDELAHAAAADPLAFRLAHLAAQPRLAGVLRLAAARAGWDTPLPQGRGRGIASYHSFGSYVAVVAEVTARPAGVPRVDRVIVAADCGIVVNPDAVAAQMEGAVIFALSATLLGEITFKDGAAVERSFLDFPIVRFHEAPAVEVHLVPSREPPGGAGEPGVPPVAPAVANAIFTATGKRCRSLPVRMP